jgi:chitodextrinase
VTGYRVYRDGALVASPAGTSVSITGLSASTPYSFTVSAIDAAGNTSAPSAPLSVTTPAPADTTAPTTPTGLAASAVTPTSLTLSWSPATDNVGVTGYRVYCNGTLVVSPSSTSVQITELLPGGTCAFTVSAFDAAGNVSVPSSPLSVTTPLALVDTTAPTTPTGLAASALTLTSLTLSWSAAIDNVGVIGYRVYRDGTLVASPGGTSASITGLSASTLYSFTVSAFDAAGNVSALSAPLSVTTPVSALPQILWSAHLLGGNLNEWSEKVNSGSADTTVVTAASVGIPPHGGSYVMKQAVTGSSGGTRMQRYPEVDSSARSGTTFYWSWWDYFPSTISFGISDTFILWGLNSKSTSASAGDPFWGLVFHNTGNKLDLIWSPNDTAPAQGPHAGESGKRIYSSSTPVPVGQWVFFEVMVTPSGDFTGALNIRMNGQTLFDQSLVKTMYPNVGQTGVMLWIEQCGYGSGLTPTPAIHYVDDVTISLGRMPYP